MEVCIVLGATTILEYKKYIEKDAALERRFQPIVVDEPKLEDAIAILRGLRERYEIFHSVRITEDALHAAVHLSHRYIADRKLPDKAIDLIDEAASMLRMQIGSMPLPIDTKERELSQLIVKKEGLSREGTNASKAEMKNLEADIATLNEELSALKQRWDKEKGLLNQVQDFKTQLEQLRFSLEEAQRGADYNKAAEYQYSLIPQMEKAIELAETDLANQHDRLLQEEVDASIIAQIVAKWTGIPVTKMLETEAEKLLQLETELNGRVVGQKNAIIKVSEAIRRARTGLQDPHRPLGVFMFVGPTGVGKTELSKALAYTLFSDETSMIRLDMSEYMERHSVAKLIGSPPGYVGYDEGGQLTEALRRRPYAVVLLDEIEKAHPDVLNILFAII